ncbi:hypothetical protein [Natrinema sp. SYSU A 869]|nr:hypothetical protein [Natrinema sp. SYSU A 869]
MSILLSEMRSSTAAELDATLIVGGDDDYDDVEDVSLHGFRDGSS